MSRKKSLDKKDVEMMDKMISKLIGVHNDLDEFCRLECPYITNCEDFAGACALQTVKSVANLGWRVLIDQKKIIEKGSR